MTGNLRDRPDVQAAIKRIVDAAPPLSAEQRAKLYVLLAPIRAAIAAGEDPRPLDPSTQKGTAHGTEGR